ncbi:MAG: cupin domain-containing protein [Bacillota bacterium]
MNIFTLPAEAELPGVGEEELHETLFQNDQRGVLIERIVSAGQASPPGFWYDQEQDEWVVLLQGRAGLAWQDGRAMTLEKGDWVFIPAHTRHRLAWTSQEPPCIWLAVHINT